jgi:DNA-binding transcriptional MerR regulator
MDTLSPALRQGLTQQEVAKALGTTTRTLQRWQRAGFGPQPVRDGAHVLYDPVAVAAFKAGARS